MIWFNPKSIKNTNILSCKFFIGLSSKWEAQFEDVVDNPYLDDFYNQMERWSFNLQIYFLNNRYRQILQIRKGGKDTIQDRTIYEDAHIFAPNLHAMGLMTNRDFSNYTSLFELMETLVQL